MNCIMNIEERENYSRYDHFSQDDGIRNKEYELGTLPEDSDTNDELQSINQNLEKDDDLDDERTLDIENGKDKEDLDSDEEDFEEDDSEDNLENDDEFQDDEFQDDDLNDADEDFDNSNPTHPRKL